jgi:hypothetical protein
VIRPLHLRLLRASLSKFAYKGAFGCFAVEAIVSRLSRGVTSLMLMPRLPDVAFHYHKTLEGKFSISL